MKTLGSYLQPFPGAAHFLIAFSLFLGFLQLLMVVSIVLERNPELEFSDKVDLDGLVKEACNDFQRDGVRVEDAEKQVARRRAADTTGVYADMCSVALLGQHGGVLQHTTYGEKRHFQLPHQGSNDPAAAR